MQTSRDICRVQPIPADLEYTCPQHLVGFSLSMDKLLLVLLFPLHTFFCSSRIGLDIQGTKKSGYLQIELEEAEKIVRSSALMWLRISRISFHSAGWYSGHFLNIFAIIYSKEDRMLLESGKFEWLPSLFVALQFFFCKFLKPVISVCTLTLIWQLSTTEYYFSLGHGTRA